MGIVCKQCGAQVEAERECYATPMCFACLPPPKPLPKTYTQQHVATLTRERDEARAEVERLCSLLSETLPHVSHLCQTEQLPNSRHCSGCQHVSYLEGALSSNPIVYGMVTMRADDANVINELAELDVVREEGAASERAAIVAMLEAYSEELHTAARACAADGNNTAAVLRYERRNSIMLVIGRITRLDHHRDGGGE